MTEAEITQAIETILSPNGIKVTVKQRQNQLLIRLTRPKDATVDYPTITEEVRSTIRSLYLAGVDTLVIYGRAITDINKYEWQQEVPVLEPDESDPLGSTIQVPDHVRAAMRDELDDEEDEDQEEPFDQEPLVDPEEDTPTEFYTPPTGGGIAGEPPLVSGPAMLTPSTQPASVKPSTPPPPAQTPQPSASLNTSASPTDSPKSQSKSQSKWIWIGAGGLVVVVIVIVLLTRG